MHRVIKHIVASFEEVHEALKNQKDDNVTMHTPMDHINMVTVSQNHQKKEEEKMKTRRWVSDDCRVQLRIHS